MDNKDKVELPDEASKATFKRLIAEARLLRGLCYFDLVRMWGDVPMKLTSSKKSENFLIPRTDREKLYDQIIEDMTAAVADLPWHDEVSYTGRPSKGAAMGLLARAYLLAPGWQDETPGQLQRVLQTGQRSLQRTDHFASPLTKSKL